MFEVRHSVKSNVLHLSSRDSKAGAVEPCRRSERLKTHNPPRAASTRSLLKKKQPNLEDNESEEWQSEDETAEDFENDSDLGGSGEDGVQKLRVQRKNRENQVSVSIFLL